MNGNTIIKTTTGTGNKEIETEKAIAFDFGQGLVWFPKSQVTVTEINHMHIEITLPLWLAEKKGMVRRNPYSRNYEYLFNFEIIN